MVKEKKLEYCLYWMFFRLYRILKNRLWQMAQF